MCSVKIGFDRTLNDSVAAATLGLVSQQLHKYGNGYQNYPGREYKHDLGLILFSCVFTLLIVLGHYWLSLPSECDAFRR